jgi:cytochrome c oxidase assembly factor CtaG
VVPQSAPEVGWTWSWYLIVPLACIAILYTLGILELRRRNSRISRQRVLCFVAGWFSLFLALDSPIHNISELLFWVHMTQHEILMLISAPLLVMARPLIPFLWAIPENWRTRVASLSRLVTLKRTWSFLSAPLAAWMLHAIALWLWHAPPLFVSALHSEFWHAAQHISFLGTALLFWWTLFNHHGGRLGYGGAVLYVFTTVVHTSILGAWLTFSPKIWYTPYEHTARLWGLTALQDQQLGGLIMWIPAGTLLTVFGLALLLSWLRESQRRWEYTQTAALIRASAGVGYES